MAALLCLDPIVATTHGKVRGQLRKTVYGDEYFCFDGIPYAKPPLGELRFKAPKELEPWQDIRDCTEVAPTCLQYNRYTQQIEGSEDCLYLNIYVKSFNTSKLLPVMVYVHGGMCTTGSASRLAWGPDYFMMKEVVFISIGYRLGALGFLSLSDPTLNIPGNAGVKDQLQALKWIKANCSFFNGDPDNITLFGHSSGSYCVQILILNQKTFGLVHKAILMAAYVIDIPKLPNMEYRLAKLLGYNGECNDKDIYEFLRNINAEKLLSPDLFTAEEKNMGFLTPFLVCVEPYASKDSILLKQPVELLQSSWSNSIPIMIGNTTNEALLHYKKYSTNTEFYKIINRNPEYLLPLEIQLSCDIELQRKQAQKLIEFFYGDKEVSIENPYCTIELSSYIGFVHRAHRIMLARRAKRSNARTYLYRFAFDSPFFNLFRIRHCGSEIRGVAHVDELSYLYYMPSSFKLDRDLPEFKTIQRMIDMWTSFAASSNPNAPSIAPTVWEPLERNNPDVPHKCLNISNDLTFIEWPAAEKCSMLDEIYKECKMKLF